MVIMPIISSGDICKAATSASAVSPVIADPSIAMLLSGLVVQLWGEETHPRLNPVST